MHQQQHYTLFKIKKVKSQSTNPLTVIVMPNTRYPFLTQAQYEQIWNIYIAMEKALLSISLALADTLLEQESNFLQLISCVWKNVSSQNSHNQFFNICVSWWGFPNEVIVSRIGL